jgi:hypothetical protein
VVQDVHDLAEGKLVPLARIVQDWAKQGEGHEVEHGWGGRRGDAGGSEVPPGLGPGERGKSWDLGPMHRSSIGDGDQISK